MRSDDAKDSYSISEIAANWEPSLENNKGKSCLGQKETYAVSKRGLIVRARRTDHPSAYRRSN
jgi:hypothetical protein